MNTPSERVRGILEAALKLPPKERPAYVDRACGEDAPLRQRIVEALFTAQECATAIERTAPPPSPEETIVVAIPPAAPGEKSGDRIGRYKLLERRGEGGMGTVWMAEQSEPVRRKVALKIIKLGMDTKQVIARFEAERQALALMDHPNIAKVLDAGATDTGRPYFVMEFVSGEPITIYCDRQNLPTRERLNLFVQVCRAIQHAHQKGIIHRDIKPFNILVALQDGVPVPKVIDFGIAKATGGQQLTDKTLYTALEQFVGTPAYMSPEQAEMSGLDIDTRSDIYSLGVLLYELLTSKMPFDPKRLVQVGLDEIRRIIREEEPARPSTRISTLEAAEQTTVAKRRRSEPLKLIHQVRGDLDWIVMKCLEKGRTRRYETANGLAMDIQRHLNEEPVVARPPNAFYLFRKMARRHMLAFGAAGAVAVLLIMGLGISSWLYVREKEDRANEVRLYKALAPQLQELEQHTAELKKQQEEDKQLRLEMVCTLAGRSFTSKAQFSPVEKSFAVITRTGGVTILSTEGKQLHDLALPRDRVTAIAYAHDGRRLLVGTEDGNVCLWNPTTGASQTVFTNAGWEIGRLVWLANPERGVLAHNVDDKLTATNFSGLIFRVFDGQVLAKFSSFVRQDFQTLAASSDSRLLGVLEIPNRKRAGFLLDSESCEMKAELWDNEYPSGPLSIAIAPDNNTVAVGYAPNHLSLWDGAQQKELRLVNAHNNWVTSLAFSPDSKRLISGGGDSTARIWEVQTGKEIGRVRFEGESTYVNSVGFSPDGKLILAAAENDVIVVAKALR
jgi:serine/threonine protein kinase